jgi:two-component system cell cycle sensor histidine kinase/response regulator CckA
MPPEGNAMSDERAQVRADQVKQLYDLAPLGMIATIFNALALYYVLWKVVSHRTLTIWLACLFLVTIIRAVQVYYYWFKPPSPAEARSRGIQFIVGMALSGIVWGAAVLVLFPVHSLLHQVFLAFVLGGMVAGAAATFSTVKQAFLSYSIPVLVPLIFRFFSYGDEIHVTMGGITLLFAVLIHSTAWRVHAGSALSLKLRLQNKNLVSYLASEKERAEKLNEDLRTEIGERKKAEEELQKHRDHLEMLVKERTLEWERANARLQEEIAARIASEDLRRQSEVYFRSLIENALDLITVLDSSGNILFESPSIEKLLGYQREELIGDLVFDYLHPDDRPMAQDAFTRLITAPGTSEMIEIRVLHRDGSWRIFESIGKSLIDVDKAVRIIVNSRDSTDRKMLEEDILKAQKLDSLGVLAGGIAHDFNNLITGITANIELARMHVKSNDPMAQILEKAEQASIQAHSLTQQLLTFSRGGEPVMKTVVINDLIREAASFALRGSKAGPTFSLAENLRPIEVDSGQLQQVIHNIVINADQAMPQGGKIMIIGENVSLGDNEVSSLRAGDYVKICIADQGTGIPKEHLAKIFDPYFTTKKHGAGLGLATAYSIIKKHGGIIFADSELGVGTTISLYLPASKKELKTSEETSTGLRAGHGRILLMDDEAIILDAAGKILQTAGYEVEFAKEGNEAIGLYEKAREAGKPFDLVIMDLTVPGGMGGKETLAKLIELDPRVRAIVSSGYSSDPIMAHYEDYGFLGVIAKPYRVREMAEIVGKVMEVKR